jgi:large subunit ribosomal protein L7/L12
MDLSKKAQEILDLVKELSAVELAALVKALEEEFGVTAAAVAVAGVAGGGDGEEAAVKDTVSVELADAGQQKIAVIKVVKELLGLGLKEAKEKVESAPTLIKENVKMEEAEIIKSKLAEAGATVNFK